MAHSPANMAVAATVDTETVSEADAMVALASAQPTSSVRRRAALAVGAACAVAACGAVASLGRSGAAAPEPEADVLSVAAVGDYKYGRTGCSNWDKIELTRIKGATNTSCAKLCHETCGCHAYNLEPYGCPPPEGSGHAGTCIIFGDGCKQVKNHCWDLYKVAMPDVAWKKAAARKGCSNWENILIKSLDHLSAEQCGYACSQEPECKHFNVQVKPGTAYDGVCPAGGKADWACYLYKGACHPAENICWDLYDYTKPRSTTAAPATKATR